MQWQNVREEVKQEIMKTDISIEIHFPVGQKEKAELLLGEAFALMRSFASRYSRFQKHNELWELNESASCIVSEELFEILRQAKRYSSITNGVFNPTLLLALEEEGYVGAYSDRKAPAWKPTDLSQLLLEPRTRMVRKPKNMKLDLGGIGKGFAVDKVASFLGNHFENFLVDAGGDIFASGENKVDNQSWGIEVENSSEEGADLVLLLLKDKGVATSGNNRRTWKKNSATKHHLLDPATGKSSASDLVTATVVSENTLEADIFAKTLFLLGSEKAVLFSQKNNLAALLITQDRKIIATDALTTYVWNN